MKSKIGIYRLGDIVTTREYQAVMISGERGEDELYGYDITNTLGPSVRVHIDDVLKHQRVELVAGGMLTIKHLGIRI